MEESRREGRGGMASTAGAGHVESLRAVFTSSSLYGGAVRGLRRAPACCSQPRGPNRAMPRSWTGVSKL